MQTNLLIQCSMAFIAAICFGMMLNIPVKAYLPSGLIGCLSWAVYVILYFQLHLGLAMSNMIGAILISVTSMLLARQQKLPMIIYNVPALVNFVPGGQSYRMISNFVLGHNALAMTYFYQVIVIAGALSLGFGIGDLLNAAIFGRRIRGPRPFSQVLLPKKRPPKKD